MYRVPSVIIAVACILNTRLMLNYTARNFRFLTFSMWYYEGKCSRLKGEHEGRRVSWLETRREPCDKRREMQTGGEARRDMRRYEMQDGRRDESEARGVQVGRERKVWATGGRDQTGGNERNSKRN